MILDFFMKQIQWLVVYQNIYSQFEKYDETIFIIIKIIIKSKNITFMGLKLFVHASCSFTLCGISKFNKICSTLLIKLFISFTFVCLILYQQYDNMIVKEQ